MAKKLVFIDLEVSVNDKTVLDYGAVKDKDRILHTKSKADFSAFVSDADYVCGHNIIRHDLQYCSGLIKNDSYKVIDTLYLSPLLFPSKPYHRLVKDDKIVTDQLNNPANDAQKSMELFYDEVNAYSDLHPSMRHIFSGLLSKDPCFAGFFDFVSVPFSFFSLESDIRRTFPDKICKNADISGMISGSPVELAYALAIISAQDKYSVTPPWVYMSFPKVDYVLKQLRETPCEAGCEYCRQHLDVKKKLKDYFGYNEFRTYNGEPLQEKAADAAVHGKSLLAIFPTGGGKSITFQLPALMAGESSRGLTVVISPLQSLMKDQVDNLSEKGIVDAVTINGLLSPIERAEAIDRVASGMASLLYISPESLRSRTIEKLLLSRKVVRFVIDEAHCFSAWGQDFRVDYMYIGDFIRNYVKQKDLKDGIPVSCFTATAKQKVVSDIQDYFRQKLGIELELYTTNATRTNLHYAVIHKETEEEKYNALRSLLEQKDCPTIVYVSSVRKTIKLANKLTQDGYPALPFNGKMESTEKVQNQNAFINNEVRVIVATSAFGMGVDKKDVGLVVHYEISDSLENYVQEAGRAGRDQSVQADCYVLFNEDDLDKHFMLLNQTKLSLGEIQQIWKAIKDLTKNHTYLCRSALEIARQAGWDDAVADIETRVKTAIAALENAGYVERGKNVPHVYATSILAHNMEEAEKIIDSSDKFDEKQKLNSKRIIKSLISAKYISRAGNDDAESRVDYIADILGIEKEDVIQSVNLMREEGILADSMDMTAFIKKADTSNKSLQILTHFAELEKYLASKLSGEIQEINYKELNDDALKQEIKGSSVKNIRTILYFWTIKHYIQKNIDANDVQTYVFPILDKAKIEKTISRRCEIASFIVEYLFEKCADRLSEGSDEIQVQYSLLELRDNFKTRISMFNDNSECTAQEVQDALLYLSKIGSMNLEGGFLVSYNGLSVNRLVLDNKIRYKNEDYKQLNEYYQQKIQQIHIVGEYANMMVRDYDEALQFVNDYFTIEYKPFIAKYFKGTRGGEINRNITPERYEKLFGSLSETQAEIIRDDTSKYIAVIAGPGSGKTRVLVHKLASLLLLEDVKSEQLLMLTFSRAAATEFKSRLIDLIGKAAHFVEIKTFHSYCFDLLGKVGSLDEAGDIVSRAAEMISNGEVEIGRITKSVLVIDEAQDMDANEFALVTSLMSRNEDMRVIAVGDDDQNIYEFRGSDSSHLKSLISDYNAKKYEMLDNYRSDSRIVSFSNAFAKTIRYRMKSRPISSVSPADGIVELTKHPEGNMETAVVEHVKRNFHGEKTCILTSTNDEAFRVMGLLSENGMNAKLIQSNEGFNLFNLAEIRMFIKEIEKGSATPVVSDTVWNEAVRKICRVYSESDCLPLVHKLIKTFSDLNPSKYRSDFIEYVNESKLEDFYESEKTTVLVSTIHKAKGREFDSVYIVLSQGMNPYEEKNKRAIYVGLTRAKHELYVHYANPFLDRFGLSGVTYRTDNTVYPEPRQIMLQLSHKDVFLSYFKNVKKNVFMLHSGSPLEYEEGALYAILSGTRKIVAKLSKKCVEMLDELKEKGYVISTAKVRFIVAWKGEDDEEEIPVVLPDIHLVKLDGTDTDPGTVE